MDCKDCKVGQRVIVNNNAGTKDLIGYIGIIGTVNRDFVRVNFIEKPGFKMNNVGLRNITGYGFGFYPDSLDLYEPETNREAAIYCLKKE